ncbi:hypothetical protein D0T51_04770 [Parabacteroides sp. 52]|uniref:DUF5606 family protein n=1 Tax=unclassified Parabacteroides TaxID=2649774 RepID=UPI0013D0901C|nr:MULTISPECIES: DUF5606 domain-containing protein [unclassified Parabacteroides]MDH6534508.1 hypothetical protein [Parabacteroides sp. PM5-20]NDV55041.1 hypothetical protein [Parabacteroides sp. 52]
MLKTILSISGKPGLYKLISQGKNMLIVEALSDKKRIPAYAKDKIISLGDIAIYTEEEEVPLYEVLTAIKEKENGGKSALNPTGAKPEDLRAYMAEVLPSFDRERVHPSDIKKLISWYNLLTKNELTNFKPEEKEKVEETDK